MGRLRDFWRKHWRRILAVYLLLLIASQAFLAWKGEDLKEGSELQIKWKEGFLAYHEWGEREGIPLILSHGSPGGGGGDFEEFAQLLAKQRWVIAPDRTGFGRSAKKASDLSFVTDARATLQLMDELGIEQADVMGWSYGGGVVLEIAAREPERVRSVGLLGAIGIQEGEGSGSYVVEHLKYELLRVIMVWLPEAIPHFGFAGPDWFRRSFVNDFADADQRPLRNIISKIKKPVLIVHGKDDPLVPAWVAEEHHNLISNSQLEIIEGSHFFPVGGQGMEKAAVKVEGFLRAVAVNENISSANYETRRKKMKAIWTGGPELRGWKPWWLVMALSAGAAWFQPRLTLFFVMLGGGLLLWDSLVGIAGFLLVLLGKKFLAKEPEKPRSKWFPCYLFFDFVAGSIVGAFLLAVL